MNLLSLTIPPWARWLALALAFAFVFMFGDMRGRSVEGQKHIEYVQKQAAQAVKINQAQTKVVVQTEIQYRDRIQVVKEKGDVVIKEVPVYITAETDQQFPVPLGFVRMHDAAANGDDSGAPSDSDGKASGVKISEVATTVAENYGQCRIWREQLIGWQTYYENLRAATN